MDATLRIPWRQPPNYPPVSVTRSPPFLFSPSGGGATAAYHIEHQSALGSVATVLAVAIPVAAHICLVYVMYMLLVHTWDAFHALLVTLTAIVLIAAIGTRPRRSHTAWPGRAYGVGEPAWLLRRMSIRHRIRVCCVCSMQTRTGVSVSGGHT
jgi:hypothetical protein